MTTRDELAALIMRGRAPGEALGSDEIADQILARWRLVPVEPTGPCGAINPDTGDACALTTGHARHHLSAEQRDEIRQRKQHRAASELTQHDQAAGHYDERPPTMSTEQNKRDALTRLEAARKNPTDTAELDAAQAAYDDADQADAPRLRAAYDIVQRELGPHE